MQTKFKEVAHLYLGCKMWITKNIEGKDVIEPLTRKMLYEDEDMLELDEPFAYKPILYPFSSFTEDQTRAWFKIALDHITDIAEIDDRMVTNATKAIRSKGISSVDFDSDDAESANLIPYLINFLLSEGYDLFNLIESGQAINGAASSN